MQQQKLLCGLASPLYPSASQESQRAVVVGNVAVSGIPVQLIGPEQRQKSVGGCAE